MRTKAITAASVAAATVAAVVIGGGAAGAATTQYEFVGYAGGSLVRALNNTITSDLTAASSINALFPTRMTNTAAGLSVEQLLTTDGVSTSTTAQQVAGGYTVVSEAKTANVNALNGLITATAIDSVSTATLVNGAVKTSVTTQLVGLKIAGKSLPVNVPNNYHITIPNIATVYVNYAVRAQAAPKAMALGMGLYVDLLRPAGTAKAGAVVAINPTYAAIGPFVPPDTGHYVIGNAYGTQVVAKVGSLANVQSDPTAPVNLDPAGSNGTPVTSSIAGVNLTPLARVGAVTNSVDGTNTNALYESESTSRIAAINLFNGLITADAITADAHVRGAPGTTTSVTGSSNLVNLKINGKPITLNTKPNTTINLLGLGTITINQQLATVNRITVRALDIKLSVARYGFPAGAEVQVATASAGAW